ncbi:MAG TPA: hypothetical protein VF702_07475 [Allosphingosinicella sp.]
MAGVLRLVSLMNAWLACGELPGERHNIDSDTSAQVDLPGAESWEHSIPDDASALPCGQAPIVSRPRAAVFQVTDRQLASVDDGPDRHVLAN